MLFCYCWVPSSNDDWNWCRGSGGARYSENTSKVSRGNLLCHFNKNHNNFFLYYFFLIFCNIVHHEWSEWMMMIWRRKIVRYKIVEIFATQDETCRASDSRCHRQYNASSSIISRKSGFTWLFHDQYHQISSYICFLLFVIIIYSKKETDKTSVNVLFCWKKLFP